MIFKGFSIAKNCLRPESVLLMKKKKKKKIVIIGHSMLRYQRPKFFSKNNNFVNVRFHPGATTKDIVDFIKPVIRKKTDAVIIHAELMI